MWAFGHPLPAWLLQGRVGITPPWPRCSYLLTLWAWHTTVSLQSKERRVQGAFLPLHYTAPTPHRALHGSALDPTQDPWAVTAMPRHCHQQVPGTPGPCLGTLSPSRPSLPARPAPHGPPGIGGTKGQGQQELWGHPGSWHRTRTPFSLPRHGRTVPWVPALLTFLPCSPGGPRGPCRGGWRRCHLWCDKANAQAAQSRRAQRALGAWLLAWAAPACLPFSQDTHPVSWVPGAAG